MADKNSFIFRLQWAEALSGCDAEVRLEVYDAIIRYAQSGTLSELKPIAGMAFNFIKQDMDHDRQQYEASIERKREGGRKGGKSKSESNAKQSQAMSSIPKDSQAYPDIPNDSQAMSSIPKDSQAYSSIYDNVYDNINIISSSSTGARMRTRGGDISRDDAPFDAKLFLDEFFSQEIQIEQFCMKHKTTKQKLRELAAEVLNDWQLTGQDIDHIDLTDARKHLLSQLRIKINLTNDSTKNNPAGGRKGSKLPPAPGFGLA